MGEQNRRAVEVEGTPGDDAKPRGGPVGGPVPAPDPGERTAVDAEADERQTKRQAPASSDPGRGVGVDGIGLGEPAGR